MRILGLVLVLSACSAAPGRQEDPGQVARIQAMQEHLENLRARGAVQPEKYESSKAQLDAELRRAQGR